MKTIKKLEVAELVNNPATLSNLVIEIWFTNPVYSFGPVILKEGERTLGKVSKNILKWFTCEPAPIQPPKEKNIFHFIIKKLTEAVLKNKAYLAWQKKRRQK